MRVFFIGFSEHLYDLGQGQGGVLYFCIRSLYALEYSLGGPEFSGKGDFFWGVELGR